MTISRVRSVVAFAVTGAVLTGCSAAPPGDDVANNPSALAMCGQFDTFNVDNKAYVVQNNEWGGNFGQCLDVNGTSFAVTSGTFNASTSGAPSTYPSIFRGCHWGNCTNNSGMPVQVSSMGSVTSSWSTVPTSGAYDVAYDIWFNKAATTNGQPNGAELMIWINRGGSPQPAGSKVANVTVAGASWDVWLNYSFGWTYVAYFRTSGVNAVTDLDIKAITNDSVNRGYIDRSWYLIDIEAGFEIWNGGVGLKTNSFSASVTSGSNTGGGSGGGTDAGGGSTGGGTASPFSGSPVAIPGKIEAENFDNGGEGVAYHDSDAQNAGGAYRTTGVDLEATTDSGGGSNVGWTSAGEWLGYTVNVTSAGTYALQARVASSGAGGTFHVEMGGSNKTGPMTIPNSGGWQSWTTLTATVNLGAGTQTMKVVEDSNGANGGIGNLNWINFVPGSSGGGGSTIAPSAPTGFVATAGDGQVALAWTASPGVNSYNVSRSTTSGSGYAAIATGVASTSYTNVGLANGTTYYYVASASNSAGTSANSSQVSATPSAPVSTGSAPCPGAVTVTGGQSGNFNTTSAACYRTLDNINGWGCSNFDGRSVKVNNAATTCGALPLPMKWSDGYRYFTITAGTLPYASLYWW